MDLDIWEDWQDHIDHPKDMIDEPDYQEGFEWTCCQGVAENIGCIVSSHKFDTIRRSAERRPVTPAIQASQVQQGRDLPTQQQLGRHPTAQMSQNIGPLQSAAREDQRRVAHSQPLEDHHLAKRRRKGGL